MNKKSGILFSGGKNNRKPKNDNSQNQLNALNFGRKNNNDPNINLLNQFKLFKNIQYNSMHGLPHPYHTNSFGNIQHSNRNHYSLNDTVEQKHHFSKCDTLQFNKV